MILLLLLRKFIFSYQFSSPPFLSLFLACFSFSEPCFYFFSLSHDSFSRFFGSCHFLRFFCPNIKGVRGHTPFVSPESPPWSIRFELLAHQSTSNAAFPQWQMTAWVLVENFLTVMCRMKLGMLGVFFSQDLLGDWDRRKIPWCRNWIGWILASQNISGEVLVERWLSPEVLKVAPLRKVILFERRPSPQWT